MMQGVIAQGGMAVPQAAIDLAKRFEGFHRVPLRQNSCQTDIQRMIRKPVPSSMGIGRPPP